LGVTLDFLDKLGLDYGCAAYVDMRLTATRNEPIARQYVTAPITARLTPKILCSERARQKAAAIGRAVYREAQNRPKWNGHLMNTYAQSVTTDGWVELASLEEPALLNYGKQLIAFVDRLDMPDLEVGLVGFRGLHGQTDMNAWTAALGLKGRNLNRRIIKARNVKAVSAMQHLGLEIVRRRPKGKMTQDGAFHSVMIVGTLIEVWRFALPFVFDVVLGAPPRQRCQTTNPVSQSLAHSGATEDAIVRLHSIGGPETFVVPLPEFN
jgi:hypothetical protein